MLQIKKKKQQQILHMVTIDDLNDYKAFTSCNGLVSPDGIYEEFKWTLN